MQTLNNILPLSTSKQYTITTITINKAQRIMVLALRCDEAVDESEIVALKEQITAHFKLNKLEFSLVMRREIAGRSVWISAERPQNHENAAPLPSNDDVPQWEEADMPNFSDDDTPPPEELHISTPPHKYEERTPNVALTSDGITPIAALTMSMGRCVICGMVLTAKLSPHKNGQIIETSVSDATGIVRVRLAPGSGTDAAALAALQREAVPGAYVKLTGSLTINDRNSQARPFFKPTRVTVLDANYEQEHTAEW